MILAAVIIGFKLKLHDWEVSLVRHMIGSQNWQQGPFFANVPARSRLFAKLNCHFAACFSNREIFAFVTFIFLTQFTIS